MREPAISPLKRRTPLLGPSLIVGLCALTLLGLASRAPAEVPAPVAPEAGDATPAGRPPAIQQPASGLPLALRSIPAAVDSGYVIDNEVVTRNCGTCHVRDASGRMGRLSYLRKTPEGWQNSIRRMVALYGVRLEASEAREIVRYLATAQGLAPEELRPGLFEVENRMVQFRYADEETEETCTACHSMGRVITVRRTPEEWQLLIATHRALYPLVDRQVFYSDDDEEEDAPTDHPVEKAIEHLSAAFPLETPEWQAWSANLRPARLEGRWALSGHEPGRGPVVGMVEVQAVPGRPDEFTTTSRYRYPADGSTVTRTGSGLVYTGYQWRGRTRGAAGADDLREVMTVSRGWDAMSGRWFTGAHNEFGLDVTLRRAGAEPTVAAVYPRALRSGGAEQQITLYGANLPTELTPDAVDLGPGVEVAGVVRTTPEAATLRVRATEGAAPGNRDLFFRGASLADALVVYDRIDRIEVTPELGLARIGGIVVPKQYQQFEAIGFQNGLDGEPDTADDIEIGPVEVEWRLEEYPVTYDDDDIQFVGSIDSRGLFTPNQDGPNPERSRNRNNIGEVWVTARYSDPTAADRTLQARAYLIVAPPVHLRWEGWDGSPTGDLNEIPR